MPQLPLLLLLLVLDELMLLVVLLLLVLLLLPARERSPAMDNVGGHAEWLE